MEHGEFLSSLRKKRGLSQNDIADILGYSPQLVSLWEKDKALPDLSVISKYAATLSIDLEGFIDCKEQLNNNLCVDKSFDSESFSSFIKWLRKDRKLLQSDIAKMMYVNVKSISSWENNVSTPSINQFKQLCSLFNLSYDELYFCFESKESKATVKSKPDNKKKRSVLPIIIIVGVLSLGGVATGIGFLIKNNISNKSSVPPVTIKDNFKVFAETNHVTYGYYPQAKVDDQSIIDSLNNMSNPTTGDKYLLNDVYYVKHSNSWFVCEDISWIILSKTDNEYLLVSEKLLDVQRFYHSLSDRTIDNKTIYPSNYEHSDIRTWLNDSFYNSAFFLHNAHIKNTVVDNSAASTDSSDNQYACNNTTDKVFLLSYQEYNNINYGFDSPNSRRARHTDYSVALGGYSDAGYGYHWTRSPDSNSPTIPWCVNQQGQLYTTYGGDVTVKNCSIRPAITVIE